MRTGVLASLGLGMLFMAGCTAREQGGPVPEAAPTGKRTIYVDNYPLWYFSQHLAGDAAKIEFPVPPDRDPAYWQPDDEAILAYQRADLILLNGAEFARWTQRVSLPEWKTVDTAAGFKDRWIVLEDAEVHSHGPEGEHSHAGVAGQTWLDPSLAQRQADAVAAALTELLPQRAKQIAAQRAELAGELAALQSQLAQISAKNPAMPLLASHPVYPYLARAGKWNLRHVHWEPDQFPTEEQWRDLDAILAEHPSKWMLWEGEPLPQTKEKLAERGIDCVVVETLANRPASGDFLSQMRENLDRLAPIFDPSTRPK